MAYRSEPSLCDLEPVALPQHQVGYWHPHIHQRHLRMTVGSIIVACTTHSTHMGQGRADKDSAVRVGWTRGVLNIYISEYLELYINTEDGERPDDF